MSSDLSQMTNESMERPVDGDGGDDGQDREPVLAQFLRSIQAEEEKRLDVDRLGRCVFKQAKLHQV